MFRPNLKGIGGECRVKFQIFGKMGSFVTRNGCQDMMRLSRLLFALFGPLYRENPFTKWFQNTKNCYGASLGAYVRHCVRIYVRIFENFDFSATFRSAKISRILYYRFFEVFARKKWAMNQNFKNSYTAFLDNPLRMPLASSQHSRTIL